MDRAFLALGAASAFLAVAAGAFGAHGLRDRISVDALGIFQTGTQYHVYHALALLAVGLLLGKVASGGVPWLVAAGWLFAVGTVLFSGSLYLLALTDVRWLGAITPLGGLAFLAGWVALGVGAWRG